ncbi:MAG: branched-chain amino acid ABC transporter permease [Xanthobacteraceae bacterium]
MVHFAEYVLRGALAGSIYALLAAPMSLLFATARTIDFAIGAYALIAAAVAATVGGTVGLEAGLAAAILCSGVMALIFIALKRLGCEDGIIFALASFGLSAVIESCVLWYWGAKSFIVSYIADSWTIGGIRLDQQGLLNLLIATVVVAILHVVVRHTSLGRMMRASAVNAVGAILAAIPVEWVQVGVYLVGGVLGGLAGLLVLYSAGIDFTAPLGLTLSGFGAAIVFGIGSPSRCLFGGIAMGIAQALASGYFSEALSAMTPFLFILIVLATRPADVEALAGGRP